MIGTDSINMGNADNINDVNVTTIEELDLPSDEQLRDDYESKYGINSFIQWIWKVLKYHLCSSYSSTIRKVDIGAIEDWENELYDAFLQDKAEDEIYPNSNEIYDNILQIVEFIQGHYDKQNDKSHIEEYNHFSNDDSSVKSISMPFDLTLGDVDDDLDFGFDLVNYNEGNDFYTCNDSDILTINPNNMTDISYNSGQQEFDDLFNKKGVYFDDKYRNSSSGLYASTSKTDYIDSSLNLDNVNINETLPWLDFSVVQIGDIIKGLVVMTDCKVGKFSNGHSFLKGHFKDKNGLSIEWSKFDYSEKKGNFDLLGYNNKPVYVECNVNVTNGKKFLKVSLIDTTIVDSVGAKTDKSNTESSITPLNSEFCATFMAILSCIDNKDIFQFMNYIFCKRKFLDIYNQCDACINHNSGISLLTHTTRVAILAYSALQLYECNPSIVIAGAMVHDIGKTFNILESNSFKLGNDFRHRFTSSDSIIEHIVNGVLILDKLYNDFQADVSNNSCDEDMFLRLRDIVASHHDIVDLSAHRNYTSIESDIVAYSNIMECKLSER